MDKILTELGDEALILASKNNLYEFFGYLRSWEKTEFSVSPVLWRWWSPVAHPWFNAAYSLKPPSGDETALIQETLEYFRSRGRRSITWWLAPEVETSAWGAQLEANGWKAMTDLPGMAADLNAMNEDLRLPDGLEIIRVEDSQTMDIWTSVFIPGFELPEAWMPDMLEMMLALGMGSEMINYLATVDGEPVATSTIYFGAGAAGIYCVSTLPEWRGRGLGAAVTLLPLLEARSQGYQVGVLQSSEMGYKIYQRLGFREVCKMSHYYWQES